MKKDKVKCGIYLPKEIYAELYRRQLPEHFSFLVACLLEEFFKRTDISISREEMPTRAEQRAYLEKKVRELFSRAGATTELPKPPVQERMESAYMQERFSQRETPAEPPRPPVQERAGHTYNEPPRTSTQERMENYAEPQDDFSFSKEDRWWESLW
jgi:hypothetical protein